MRQPLYRQIASTLQAMRNCRDSGNTEWYDKHRERLEDMARDHLPSGAGIDGGCRLSLDEQGSSPNRVTILFDYHHMNDMGTYTHWSGYYLHIETSLVYELCLDLASQGDEPLDEHLADYLCEVFDHVLRQVVEMQTDGTLAVVNDTK